MKAGWFNAWITEKNTLEYGGTGIMIGSRDCATIGNASLRKQVELGEERGIEERLHFDT